jgi:hypothetical protein
LLLLDGQIHHDTHSIPMGNYVIGVGITGSGANSVIGLADGGAGKPPAGRGRGMAIAEFG